MSPMDPLDIEPKIEIVRAGMPKVLVGKAEKLGELIYHRIPEDHRDSGFIRKVKRLIAAMVTEESTDVLIDMVKGVAPWGSGFIIGWVLDKLLPEKLLALVYITLDKVAA